MDSKQSAACLSKTDMVHCSNKEHNTLKYKRRFCKVEGCQRTVKSQQVCQRHGAKPRICKVHCCRKQAQGTFEGMCKAHFKKRKTGATAHAYAPVATSASFASGSVLLPHPSHSQRPSCGPSVILPSMKLPFSRQQGFPSFPPPTLQQATTQASAKSSCVPDLNSSGSNTFLEAEQHDRTESKVGSSEAVESWIDKTDFHNFVLRRGTVDSVTTTENSTSTQVTESGTSTSTGEEEDDLFNFCAAFSEDLSNADFIHPSMWDDGVADVAIDLLDVHQLRSIHG